MASTTLPHLTLSPIELSYLYTSLSLSTPSKATPHHHHTGPIRPDSRSPTQFRPLVAEVDILPSCFGSSRVIIGGGEGGECIVGIKGEVEKSTTDSRVSDGSSSDGEQQEQKENWRNWMEISVDTQGLRDDDTLNVFIAAVIGEGVFAAEDTGADNGGHRGTTPTSRRLRNSLRINDRFHWKLYIDILLITSPSTSTSHPLTLSSLATYLALTTAKLPHLTSEGNEDPVFNDDWDQALPLYRASSPHRPPISLLAMSVGRNVFVDPSREELSVAEGCWCITVDCSGFSPKTMPTKRKSKKSSSSGILTILGIRTLESFSSPTIPTPSSITGSGGGFAEQESVVGGRGGINISMLKKAVKVVGAVAPEVWEALEGIVERERNSKRE